MLITVQRDAEARMIKHLLSLQSDGNFCDLTIKTCSEPVHAHKCILASSLDYFRTSFSFSALTRAETNIDLSHLQCDAGVVRKVIRSLYSNEISITEHDVAGILQLADYFMHSDLLLGIEKYMDSTLDISKAALFFQLCLQYGFDKSPLFTRVCVLLSSRMHDCLIHQSSSLEWTLDVMEAMMRHNLFDYCTPLQMTKFILKKLEMLLCKSHLYGKEELSETSIAILNILDLFFAHIDKSTLYKWGSSIIDFFNSWMKSVNDRISTMNNVWTKLIVIRNSAKSVNTDVTKILDSLSNQIQQRDTSSTPIVQGESTTPVAMIAPLSSEECTNEKALDSSTDSVSEASESDRTKQLFVNMSSLKGDNVVCISPYNRAEPPNQERISGSSDSSDNASGTLSTDNDKNDSLSSNLSQNSIYVPPPPEDDSERLMESQNEFNLRDTCKGLVVLSPSHEMVSQLMDVEDSTAKPLLRFPKLSLHLYDTDLRMWRFAGNTDFPLHGHMMEKHAWRMAFVNKSLFLFSLNKRKGLEYNTESGEWSELSCANLFQPHHSLDDNDASTGDGSEGMSSFVVRSIIPVSMEDSLVVLSMSREPQADRSFWTQQHIYQFDFETKTFKHITCVRDARMALPMTKWTVDGNDLVTVKASTMMFGEIQMYNVQHIHVYNSKCQQLETHHVDCPMKSGLKIFLQHKKLFLLNNFCEYRIYCLVTRELSDWIRLSNVSPYLNCGDPDLEISYPAGIRVSCHAGSSRWILNSNFNVESASLSELHVSKDGDFVQRCHPNPPFLYMMTMCSAKLNKTQMASLDQAVYHVSTMTN